ncbi:glycosyl hydrolase family 18 protein [Mariniflexile ostreae]|uniref:chitinase n=1 Tax=Mariniflexile ostreae TaxID=1520892 RepID=A0ABV5FFJ9_9FLAO
MTYIKRLRQLTKECFFKPLNIKTLFFLFFNLYINFNYAQVNTGGNANTSKHNKQVIGYITNWDAWKSDNAGVPSAGALTQLNIDYSKYTILNYSFFGVAVDGSLHSGDLRNKQIYQSGTVQQPADLLYGDVYSSWDFYILFGEIEPIQWINEAVKERAEALGFKVAVGGSTWTHPQWGLEGVLPLPLPKEGSGAKGLLDLAHQNGVKVMASIGGWSMCKHFPEMAADPVKRARFIEDCKKLINMGFDGIDLDWEYPGVFSGMNFTGTYADYANFENLVQEIRNAIGSDKLITAAMAGDYKKLEGFNWSKLANSMDYFNMMTYDFNGGWSNKAGHNAPVYPYDGAEAPDFNWQTLFNKMTAMGVPSNKINFGIPFYGRGVVTNGNAALNAATVKTNVTIQPDGPVSTAADYTNWPLDVYDGTPNYFFINQKTGAGSGWTKQWDNQAKVPYMTKGNFFLSYDDEESIGIKAQYIKDNNLAGTIVWTVFGDLEISGSYESYGTKLKRWSTVKSPLINKVNEVFANGIVGNINPTVSITSPSPNATFNAGTEITITANATDIDGDITKVEFYNDDVLIGEDTSAPYAFSWMNVAPGNYTIKAKAFDNQNYSATSSVSIRVSRTGGNQTPMVSIISPKNGETFTAGTIINIAANVTDTDGTIKTVEFYNGTTLLGKKTTAPYTYTWANVLEGSHTINVKATDNESGVTETSVSLIVKNSGGASCTSAAYVPGQVYIKGDRVSYMENEYQAEWWTQNNNPVTNQEGVWTLIGPCSEGNNTIPTVVITSPNYGQSYTEGANVTINVNASGNDGSITKIEFFSNGTKLGEDTSSPYSFNWNNIAAGHYSLTTKSTDSNNLLTTSSAVNINVTSTDSDDCDNNDNGFKVVGYSPSWQGDANNIQYDKLTHINYAFALPRADGSIEPIENVQKLQQVVSLGHQQGVKVLIAIGGWDIGDGGGNDNRFIQLASTAATRTAFVNNVINLVNQYNLDGVDIDWEYPDDQGAAGQPQNYLLLMQELSVQLHSRGKLLTAAVVAQGWAGTGILTEVFDAVDFLNLMAYDGGDGALHSPLSYAESSLDYWLGRGLPKSKAILGVPFYGRPSWKSYATLIAEGASSTSDVYNGVYYNGTTTIKKKAELAQQRGGGIMIWELSHDTSNASTSLLAAIHQVNGNPCGEANIAPAVSLTSPQSGSSFIIGNDIAISANANDPDGSVTKVAFYVNGNKISEDTSSPYTANWTAVIGSHTLTAIAIDNSNANTTSSVVNIIVEMNTGEGCDTSHYVDGSTYNTGDIVQNFGKKYECLVGGWCTIGGPYTPGSVDDWAWPNAWKEVGVCTEERNLTTIDLQKSNKENLNHKSVLDEGIIKSVKVYPNPVKEGLMYLNIETSKANENITLQVFNLNGVKVLEFKDKVLKEGFNLKTYNISNLESGMYFYTISVATRTINGKIIKQ